MILINYLASFFLITLGLYCIVTKHDLLKSVIGLSIIDYGVNLFIVSVGFNDGGTAPIYTISELLNGAASTYFVDPVPQALTLTSIVIGACVDAMALALVVMISRKYHSINADDVRRIRG